MREEGEEEAESYVKGQWESRVLNVEGLTARYHKPVVVSCGASTQRRMRTTFALRQSTRTKSHDGSEPVRRE